MPRKIRVDVAVPGDFIRSPRWGSKPCDERPAQRTLLKKCLTAILSTYPREQSTTENDTFSNRLLASRNQTDGRARLVWLSQSQSGQAHFAEEVRNRANQLFVTFSHSTKYRQRNTKRIRQRTEICVQVYNCVFDVHCSRCIPLQKLHLQGLEAEKNTVGQALPAWVSLGSGT